MAIPALLIGLASIAGEQIFSYMLNNVVSESKNGQTFSEDQQLARLVYRVGGSVSKERIRREIVKCWLLKLFAWSDGEYDDNEKLYLIDKITQSPDLPSDVKIKIIKDLQNPPSEFAEQNQDLDITKDDFLNNDYEIEGFRKLLSELAMADGEVPDGEVSFFDKILEKAL